MIRNGLLLNFNIKKMKNLKFPYNGLGKRKTAVAKVFIENGTGNITINNKTIETYFFGRTRESEIIKTPLILLKLLTNYNIKILVKGGGVNSQLEAIRLGISKTLCLINFNYRLILKQNLLLKRDVRIKERRKYGLKKARKASQYSKR